MSKLIAVVDDEQDILDLVIHHLEKSGFEAKGFLDPKEFFQFIEKKIPSLIILDLMLPETDGFEICKFLQKHENYASIPIIMLTARVDEADKVLGLELGADDYVTKPFSPRELVARVKAVLRRMSISGEKKQISIKDIITIDAEKYEVCVKDKKIPLTTTEFKILHLLATRKSIVFSRDQILDYLWGAQHAVLDRTIDVHVKNLRDKIGKASSFIKNVRGIGYKFDDE
ncbi:response regulator [Chlamydiota bacterium]